MPQVEGAWRFGRGTRSARFPADTVGWQRTDWTLSPDSSSGENWAAEEIALPNAWGCSIGDAQTKVAVLDHPFDSTEVALNAVSPLPTYGAHPNDPDRHETAVAGILASPGDNGKGMAGVMWKAALLLKDFGRDTVPFDQMATEVANAANAGYKIANLSYGREQLAVPNSSDSTVVIEGLNAFIAGYRLIPAAQRPLLVVPAGNDRADAWLSVLPALRDRFPATVLVVGASQQRLGASPRDRWGGANFNIQQFSGSNHGSLVDVYAPASVVRAPRLVNGVEQVVTAEATSFAAPQVSGIAGLLLSLDPQLTASELKTLILNGASSGNRSMANHAGKYLVNAYESLRLASKQKSSVPICGLTMRTVKVGGADAIVTERDVPDTLLASEPSGNIRMVSVAQGGRKVATTGCINCTSQYTDIFTLGSGAWTRSTENGPFMMQFLERDTAYLRGSITSARHDLFVRIGSTDAARETQGEIPVTASAPNSSLGSALWDIEMPSVSPTGDWVLFRWNHLAPCGSSHEAIYRLYAVPLRSGQPVVARQQNSGCAGTPVGFEDWGSTAWRSEGAEFFSVTSSFPANFQTVFSDMSFRRFTVSGNVIAETGTPVLVPERSPKGVYWEPDGTRIRVAEVLEPVPTCQVTIRQAANPGTVLQTLPYCDFYSTIGPTFDIERTTVAAGGGVVDRMSGIDWVTRQARLLEARRSAAHR